MIDTDASPNLIKRRSIHPETSISSNDILSLSGITSEKIKTLESVVVKFMGYPVHLHVVPNNFPIMQEGILGYNLLQGATKIDFGQRAIQWQGMTFPFATRVTIVISAKTRSMFYVKIKNPNISVRYIPRLNVCKDVYVGKAIVSNRNGKAYVQAINTSNVDRELVVPTIELQEVDKISNAPASDNLGRQSNQKTSNSRDNLERRDSSNSDS